MAIKIESVTCEIPRRKGPIKCVDPSTNEPLGRFNGEYDEISISSNNAYLESDDSISIIELGLFPYCFDVIDKRTGKRSLFCRVNPIEIKDTEEYVREKYATSCNLWKYY